MRALFSLPPCYPSLRLADDIRRFLKALLAGSVCDAAIQVSTAWDAVAFLLRANSMDLLPSRRCHLLPWCCLRGDLRGGITRSALQALLLGLQCMDLPSLLSHHATVPSLRLPPASPTYHYNTALAYLVPSPYTLLPWGSFATFSPLPIVLSTLGLACFFCQWTSCCMRLALRASLPRVFSGYSAGLAERTTVTPFAAISRRAGLPSDFALRIAGSALLHSSAGRFLLPRRWLHARAPAASRCRTLQRTCRYRPSLPTCLPLPCTCLTPSLPCPTLPAEFGGPVPEEGYPTAYPVPVFSTFFLLCLCTPPMSFLPLPAYA